MTKYATGVATPDGYLDPITVYISGPMRGYPRYNFDAFYEAEDYVIDRWGPHRNDQVTVLNPARQDEEAGFDPDSTDVTPEQLHQWMRRDVADVAASDRILLLEGWERSEGARRELSVAKWCGVDPWLYVDGHTTQPGEGEDTTEQRYDVLAEICNEADELKAAQDFEIWTESTRRFPPGTFQSEQTPAERNGLRGEALLEAHGLITGDRNNTYGPPHQDFQRTADMLTALMGEKLAEGEYFQAHDIAQIIILVKLSRLQWTPLKRDSWVDIAGYAGCGYEAAVLTHGHEVE